MALNSTKFSTEMFADKLQMDTLIRFQINVYSSVLVYKICCIHDLYVLYIGIQKS